MKCPSCGNLDAYVGFTTVECPSLKFMHRSSKAVSAFVADIVEDAMALPFKDFKVVDQHIEGDTIHMTVKFMALVTFIPITFNIT